MDLTLLRALSARQRFRSLRHAVPEGTLEGTTLAMLQWFEVYWAAYPEHEFIQVESLMSLIRLRSGHASPEAVALTLHTAKQLENPIDDATLAGMLGQLHELDLAGRAAALVTRYQNGEEVELAYELSRLSQSTVRSMSQSTPDDYIQTPIAELLAEISDDKGIKFRRLMILAENVAAVQGGASIAIGARPDRGKCGRIGEPIILADGRTVPIESVRVGDRIAGPYQNNVVTGTCRGFAPMYRVTYPWGESYEVNDAHILSLKRSKAEGKHQTGDVLNVNVVDYMNWPESRKSRYKGWKSGIELPATEQLVPPYILGAWLGDGTSATAAITSMDHEIIAEVSAYYGEPSKVRPAGKASTYFWARTGFQQELRAIGVLGNKHIPDQYLRASRRQRLELLAGIVDTDGHIGDVIEVVTKLDTLKDGYVWLARSLGFHAVATKRFTRATNCDHAGDWYWRVRIGSEALVSLPLRRKEHHRRIAERGDRPSKRHGLHFNIKVEPVGVGEYAGFGLDGDHLFLLGDFTVTHNTSFIANTITDFAPQCREFFGDRPILWLNNEGSGKRIIPRVYQAALGLDLPGIIELSNKGELESEYTKAIGGWREMIRVKDMHGASMAQIEQVVEAMNPCVVIADMLANFRVHARGGGNKAEEVEQLWQEWREMAVRHDFVGMATVQISAEGGNNLWPPYSALKDSKTGIQGATDLILLLGSMDDPSMQAIRGISTPKNKFAMPGRQSYVTGQIVMDAGRCVFSDSPETPVATFPGGPANAQAIQPPTRVSLGPAVAPRIPGPGAIDPDAG